MSFETEHETTTEPRPARDPYTGDSRTPGSPLDIALAAIANLDINPLCGTDHAMRLVREDMARIVRALATALGGNQGTVAAQNLAIERLQARVEAGGKLAAVLEQVQWRAKRGGQLTCPECFATPKEGHNPACGIGVALQGWEEGRRG